MRKVIVDPCAKVIEIGRYGENEATEVYLPLAEFEKFTPGGTVNVLVRRPDEDHPTPVGFTIADGCAVWTVGEDQLAVEGYGEVELRYVIGETRALSRVWSTHIGKSLLPVGDTPPDPFESWYENIITAGDRAEGFAAAAEESAEGAAESAAAARASEDNAKASETAAGGYADSAEAAKNTAVGAKDTALAAAQRAESAEDNAEAAKSAAQTAAGVAESAKDEAISAKDNAVNASGAAQSYATSAESAKNTAVSASQTATAKSGEAASSAADAAISAQAAALSADNAADSALAASQSESQAEDAREAIENLTVSAQTLAPGAEATVTKSVVEGIVNLLFGLPRGERGATGNGIASVVLNADYTLTLTFTDGTSYTTPSIRGAQGEAGADGAPGADGPNTVSSSTSTNLTGILKGDGTNVGVQTVDSDPTSGSTNPVQSGGVHTALSGKQAKLTFDTTPTQNSTNPVTSGGLYDEINPLKSALSNKVDYNIVAYANSTEENIIDTNIIISFKDGYYVNGSRETSNANFTIAYANVVGGWAYAFTTFDATNPAGANEIAFFDKNSNYIAHSNIVSKYVKKIQDNLYLHFVEAPQNAVLMKTTNSLSQKSYAYIKLIDNAEISKQLRIQEFNIPEQIITNLRSNKVDCNVPAYATCDETDIIDVNLIASFKDGYYISNGTEHRGQDFTIASAPVSENCAYAVTIWEHGSTFANTYINFFNKDGEYIPNSNVIAEFIKDIDTGLYLYFVEAPTGAVLARITAYLTQKQNVYIKKLDNEETSKQLRLIPANFPDETLNALGEVFTGKTVASEFKYGHCLNKPFDFDHKSAVFFGDSVVFGSASTYGEPGVHFCYTNWAIRLCEKFSMTRDNQAVNGSAYTDTEHSYSILNKVLDYTEQKDFIFIGGGINDWFFGDKTLGTLGDVTGDTFYGALHLVCEKFKNSFPDSTVIFLTIINMSADNATPAYPLNDFRRAMFEVATQYGFNVIDGSQIGFPIANGAYKNIMIADGIHPTDLGHEFMFKSLCGILD